VCREVNVPVDSQGPAGIGSGYEACRPVCAAAVRPGSGWPGVTDTDRQISTKNAVQIAAAQVFLERGYTDASIQEIADRLGIPKGSAYHHVQSKEQLLYDVLTSGMDDLLQRLATIVGYPLSAAERLRLAMWDSLRASFDEERPATGVALYPDIRYLSDAHRKSYVESRDRYQNLLEGLLEQGIEAGEFRAIESPKMVIFGLLGMLANARLWFRPDGDLTLQDVAAYWWDLVFSGLRAPSA
jgi:AcrR family transcriptional regulator